MEELQLATIVYLAKGRMTVDMDGNLLRMVMALWAVT